jgi:sarcosine oxidase subunit beta
MASSYDVVVVGGGGHGLATAYELAKADRTLRVAVMERSYIGAGATGRNTTIIRANYLTPEAIPFYRHSLKRYRRLSEELNYNVLFT